MKRLKNSLALLLSVIMIISALPLSALADEEYYESDASGYCDDFYWTYTKETNTVYINATETNETGIINAIDGNFSGCLPLYPTQEDYDADQNIFGVLDVDCESAFENIIIGKDISELNNVCFAESLFPILKTVTFEEGSKLRVINESMFSTSLVTELDIPDTVQQIGYEAFSASKLEKVHIPAFIDDIGELTFAGCPLGDVVIPANVESIGWGAFIESGITSLSFEEGSAIKLIDLQAFAYCKNLKSVTIPARDITFGNEVFYSCDSLETVVFDEEIEDGDAVGVRCIDYHMFSHCRGLKNITFPSTLKVIAGDAFYDAFTDEKAVVDLSNAEELTKICYTAFSNSHISKVILPTSLTTIEKGAFADSTIESIDLSNTNVTVIPTSAFNGCQELEEIILPKELEEISNYAFAYTKNLKKLDFPNSLWYIGRYAFQNSGIENVDLSECNDYLDIGEYAFQFTDSLNTIHFPQVNFERLSSDILKSSAVAHIDLPCVIEIQNGAIANCDNLESFKIPNGCKKISDNAILGCENLEELYVPFSVTSMGKPIISGTGVNLKKLVYAGTFGGECFGNAINSATVYGLAGSPLQNYCIANDIKYIELTGENVADPNVEIINGTWAGGTWSVTRAGTNCLSVKGSGNIEDRICYYSDGTETSFSDLMEKYGVNLIVFENGITSIPNYFAYTNKTSGVPETVVYLPKSLKTIGNYAFHGRNISSISIPDGVTSIGDDAFSNNKLTEFVANEALTSIGDSAFAYNDITSISLGNVKTIGDYAFYGAKITELKITSSVESIGAAAFKDVSTLTTISFPKSSNLTVINRFAFMSTGIKTLKLPASVNKICAGAFLNCKSLTTVRVSNYTCEFNIDTYSKNQNAIGFDNNGNKLNTVIYGPIGSNAQKYAEAVGLQFKAEFGDYEYCGLINQTSSAYANKPLNWYYDKGTKILYVTGEGYFNQTTLRDINGKEIDYEIEVDQIQIIGDVFSVTAPLAEFNPKEVYFSSNVSTIGEYALNNLERMTQVKIPTTVRYFYPYAFRGCNNLKYIEFGNSVPDNVCKGLSSLEFVDFGSATSIGRYAFEGCTKLQEIIIPDTVTSIGQYAFNKCTSVQSVKIGTGVTKIEPFAFSKLPLCEKVELNMASVPAYSTNIFSESGASTKGMEIALGNNVESIDMAFFNNVKLSKVVLGNNASSITNTSLVPSLKSIEVPNDNSNYYSYNNCLYSSSNVLTFVPKHLDIVEIKEGTTAIGENAFNGSNVSTITIPNSVEKIEANAFANSKRLKNIRMANGLTYIGESAFEGCELLKTLNIPSSVKTLGKYAFKNCIILASVILPEGLTGIAANCFQNCRSLSGIVIPESVVSIGSYAFSGCTELKEFYIWNTKLGSNVFSNNDKINVYTMVGSPAYEYCRRWNVPYNAYTDEDCFYDECAMKIDILAGYLGFCTDGHGDIQWLTVYENDCDNDGYMIGVCEYCSEILEERHLDAKGHNYVIVADIAPTLFSRGMTVYECQNCNQRYTVYTDKNGNGEFIETHSVSGKIVIATDKDATGGISPITNATIVIDGNTVATTNEKGQFSFDLTTGLYIAEIRYAYGFTRSIFVRVEDEDITFKEPIALIGCDFNKDGKIDNDDLTLFQYVVSAVKNDPSYLSFVDMNHDGYINAKDRAYIRECMGLDSSTFDYPLIIVQK